MRARARRVLFDDAEEIQEADATDQQLVQDTFEDDNLPIAAALDVSFVLEHVVVEEIGSIATGSDVTHEQLEHLLEENEGESGDYSVTSTPFTPRATNRRDNIFSIRRREPSSSSISPIGVIYSPNNSLEQLSPTRGMVLINAQDEEGVARAFEIFSDSSASLSAQHLFVNTEQAASQFELRVYSISRAKEAGSPTKVTRKIDTKTPNVREGSLFESGRCVFSFRATPSEDDRENLPGVMSRKKSRPVASLSIRRSLFPESLVNTRGRELMEVNPVFLVPADRHVTVLMPENADAFKGLDHFVVELTNGDNGRKLVCLAIHKRVFASLLMVNSTTITMNNVVITPRVSINVRMNVSRIRRSEERLYVNVDQIEFSVPDGFEKVYFPEGYGAGARKQVRFDDDIGWDIGYNRDVLV
jgi:hypothetical protein